MEDAEQPLFVPVHRSTVETVTPLTGNVPTPSPPPSPVPSSATTQAVSR